MTALGGPGTKPSAHVAGSVASDQQPAARLAITRRFLQGGAWVVVGKAISALSGLVVNALLTRLLVPADAGVYFLVFSIVMTAAMVAQVGLNFAVVRYVAEGLARGEHNRSREAIRQTLTFGTLAAAVVAIGFWVAPYLGVVAPSWSANWLRIAGLWCLFFAVQSLIAECFRGLHEMREASLFGGPLSGIILAGLLLFVRARSAHVSLDVILVCSLISVALATAVGLVVLGRRASRIRGHGHIGASELMRSAAPLWISSVVLYLLGQVDLWVVGAYLPSNEVATYGAASRLVALLAMPLMIVNLVLPPIIAELFTKHEMKKLQSLLQKTATVVAIPALVVLVGVAVYAREVLTLVYGGYYGGGAMIVAVLSVGQAVNILAGSCGMTLMMTGNQDYMMAITIVSGVVMTVLSVIFAKSWGPTGVAVAAATGLALQNGMMWAGAILKTGIRTNATVFSLWPPKSEGTR